MVLTIRDVITFVEDYCEKHKEQNIDWFFEEDGDFDRQVRISVGDHLMDGLLLEGTRPRFYKQDSNYKEENMEDLPLDSLIHVIVYGALFPHDEVLPNVAQSLAEEVEKELDCRVCWQPGSVTPPDAECIGIFVGNKDDGYVHSYSIQRTYGGEIEGGCYMSVARTKEELPKAIEAVLTCREKHPDKIYMLDKMKTMPEWEPFFKDIEQAVKNARAEEEFWEAEKAEHFALIEAHKEAIKENEERSKNTGI